MNVYMTKFQRSDFVKQKWHSIMAMLLAVVLLLPGIPVSAAKKALTIKTQPTSVTVYSGQTAKVTVKASGDGLKYAWYSCNAGASKFTKTGTFKGNTYEAEMNTSRHGRKVYCKITDKYGKTAKTKTVTLSMSTTLKIMTKPANTNFMKSN